MEILFGQFAGWTVERVMLLHPEYICYLLEELSLKPPLLDVRLHAVKLVSRFDQKPYTRKCSGDCLKTATRAATCCDSVVPTFWCNSCNPYEVRPCPGTVTLIGTYSQAVRHVQARLKMPSCDKIAKPIQVMAMAKGLPRRASRRDLLEFFKDGTPSDVATAELQVQAGRDAEAYRPARLIA